MICTRGVTMVDMREHDEQRIAAAVRRTVALSLEQQRLMWAGEREQLEHVRWLVAKSFDEKRRALAGAAAVPTYDPFAYVPSALEVYLESLRESVVVHLSAQQIERLKAEYERGRGLSRDALAERYGISRRRVDTLLRGELEEHATARLTRAQVAEILRCYRESAGRRGIVSELARRYGVGKNTISDIVARRTWRDVEG